MKITSIRIRTLKNTGSKMQGVAAITLDNMIAIHDIKILKNNDDLFLAMPSKQTKTGTFKDSVHPINAIVREAVERIVFSAYKACLENNYGSAQFDISLEQVDSLIEQTFSDFCLVSNAEYKDFSSIETYRLADEKTEEPQGKSKKVNPFLDWLNN